MAFNFNEDDKKVQDFGEFIPFGVSQVQFVLAEAGEVNGKTYIDVFVQDADGLEESARVWFTGGATNISFNTLRQIAVHIMKTEADKAKMGEAMDSVPDTDALVALLNKKCIGGELWFTKYYDPKRTYQSKTGVTKRSINRNVHGYPPKLKPELMPDEQRGVDPNDFPDDDPLKGAQPANTAQIPDNWA